MSTALNDACQLENQNVVSLTPLPSPADLHRRLPLAAEAGIFVARSRAAVANILAGRDPRALVVVGPCSIHDLAAGREYLARLRELAAALAERVFIVMRVYFEKPRTTTGWKGLINDPRLDDSFDIESGLTLARSFLVELAEAGMPAATEALDPIVPQYLGDLISWYAIGARTTESQTHREMASGLSAPCGFKNGTDGSVTIAVQAMQAARTAHHFLGIDGQGRTAVVRTRGNADVHLILRGGREPNYEAAQVEAAVAELGAAGLPTAVMVDCSHGNSAKNPARQPLVARAVMAQRVAGRQGIVGLMLESHLEAGNQPLVREALRYGVSITDACMGWAETEALLRELFG
ncbi:MAG: 3-deoxy-7-phosphoheptulonate synthase [Gammaproteobacteria bacterium]|nr:3-deoxy-7-phosphoheptulonate synthase [Gammaproteobacteria bacterium]MCP5198789.1 3-deoxy-7-phosphoheptulonate synthase [Gammaproteobacteria bacterium]